MHRFEVVKTLIENYLVLIRRTLTVKSYWIRTVLSLGDCEDTASQLLIPLHAAETNTVKNMEKGRKVANKSNDDALLLYKEKLLRLDEIMELNFIRTRLFAIAAAASFIWFLSLIGTPILNTLSEKYASLISLVLKLLLFGIISITASVAISTYLIQYRLQQKQKD